MDLRLGNFSIPFMAGTMVAGIREIVLLKVSKVFKMGIFFDKLLTSLFIEEGLPTKLPGR